MKLEFVENESKYLSSDQMSLLEDLLLISDEIRKGLGLRFLPMQVNGNLVRFNGISANIKYNNTELIVRPKIVGTQNNFSVEDLMRTLYLRILKTSKTNLNSVIYFTSMSAETISDETFIDSIAQYYLNKLMAAIKKLPIVIYFKKDEKRTSIKGKVLIQKELCDPIRDGKTWCRYKILSNENIYNALLKWCCIYFAENVSSKSLSFKLKQCSATLEGQREELSVSEIQSLRLPRNFEAYKEPFSIAKELFLYNMQATKIRSHSNNISGYVINMETAFENIVCYYVERYSRKNQMLHMGQASVLFALANNGNSNMNYQIRPDDLLIKDNRRLVMDAKYKYVANNDKPSRDDIYQMVSSCIAHQTSEAILIYPSVDSADLYSESWMVRNPINGDHLKIYADKIDIFSDDQTIINQIAKAVDKSNFTEVSCGKI